MQVRVGCSLVAVLWMCLACPAPGRAAKVALPGEVDQDHRLVTTVETPHTQWAKELPGNPISAFVIVNTGHGGQRYTEPGTRLREVIELMQRFHMTAEAVMVSPKGEIYQGKEGEERARELLAKPYDVYIVGNITFETLPSEFQYRILEQVVRNGAGLICCGPTSKKILTAKRKMDTLPTTFHQGVPLTQLARLAGLTEAPVSQDNATTAKQLATCYTLGKGRGVRLRYRAHTLTPYLSFRFRALTEYDYWMMFFGRALLWAASQEPRVAVQVCSTTQQVPYSVLPGGRIACRLKNEGDEPQDLQISIALRRGDGHRYTFPPRIVSLAPGSSMSIPVRLPRVRADNYFVDIQAYSDRGTEAFGAGAVVVSSERRITELRTSSPFAEPGEQLRLTAVLQGDPPTHGPTILRLQLRDSEGRVLARQDHSVKTLGEVTGDFTIEDSATILMRAEAVLLQRNQEIDFRETTFTVPKRRRNRFNFVQWGARNDVLEYYAWRQLRKAGWSVCLGSPTNALAACDISVIPYTTRLMEEHDKDGVMKPVCWNDEPTVDDYVQKIVDKQAKSRSHGAFLYSLGDEGTTKGCCVHPACLDAYRRYLENVYGTIAELNASWDENYASFVDVALLDPDDAMERGAVAKGLYARWYDRQAFSRYNLAQFANRFVKAFAKLDPKAITGFEGTGGFGDDYTAILDATAFWSPYPSIGDDILRGVADRQHIRANWMGYHKLADPLINYSWRMVMKEMDSIWWWRYDGCGSWRGYISPILDFWPATEELCKEMVDVRNGLGDVLLKSQVVHGGIAILYNLPSALSSQLGDGPGYPSPKTAHTNWLRAFYDLGLDVRYVNAETLNTGWLNYGEYRLIVLPMTQAMGPKEVVALQRFAEKGGTVLADLRPGIYNAHCRPVASEAVANLFGIAREGTKPAQKGRLEAKLKLGKRRVSLTVARTRCDPSVTPTTAQALATVGETPVIFVNKVGQGKAILLNMELPTRQGAIGLAPDAYDFLKALVGWTSVTAPFTIANAADGGPVPNLEARMWRNREMTICGAWREMDVKFFNDDGKAEETEGLELEIRLPAKKHVYDLRARSYLGETRRVRTRVRQGRANFLAALPYAIQGLALSSDNETPEPGTALTVSIALEATGDVEATHVVHAEVFAPDGIPAPWGSRVVLLPAGKGTLSIPIAWNDTPGDWRVRVTELFSRKTAELRWKITQ